MQNELVSEIYRIKEYEEKFARKLKPIMSDLGAWRALGGDILTHRWNRDYHIIEISGERDGRRRNEVVFDKHRYDPNSSKIEYGDAIAIEEDKVKVDGFSRTFNNTEPSDVMISEEVTLSKSVQHSFSQHYEFSVKSTTEIEGSYSGVKFQESLEVAFGMGFDKNETTSESTDVKQTITESLAIPADKKIIVSFEKNKLITETPFRVKGYLDFSMWLNFEDWASGDLNQGNLLFGGWHKGNKDFNFDTILDFERFLKGYDVDYPQMAAYPTHASAESKEAMDWIFNPENRVIDAVGVKRREFDNNVNITIREVA